MFRGKEVLVVVSAVSGQVPREEVPETQERDGVWCWCHPHATGGDCQDQS
jgi:hypothetical protein